MLNGSCVRELDVGVPTLIKGYVRLKNRGFLSALSYYVGMQYKGFPISYHTCESNLYIVELF